MRASSHLRLRRGAPGLAVLLALLLAVIAMRPLWLPSGPDLGVVGSAESSLTVEAAYPAAPPAATVTHKLADAVARDRVRTGARSGLVLIALLGILAGVTATRRHWPAVRPVSGAPRHHRILLPPRRGPPLR